MNVCQAQSCTVAIMAARKFCSRCQGKENQKEQKRLREERKAKRAKKAKKRQGQPNQGAYDMKARLAPNGRVKAGMGLAYLRQLDKQRWEAKQQEIAQAIVDWGIAMQASQKQAA